MKFNSLSADAVTQPGGLYANINDGLLKGIMAYFTSQDRQRQGERQVKRDEQVYGRQQLADALAQAERYGVGPRQQDAGWMAPESQQMIERAIAAYQQRQVAEQKQAMGDEMRQRYMAAQIALMEAKANGTAPGSPGKRPGSGDKPLEGRVLDDLNERALRAGAGFKAPTTEPIVDTNSVPTGKYEVPDQVAFEQRVRNPLFLDAGVDPRTYRDFATDEEYLDALMAPGVLPDLEVEGINYTRPGQSTAPASVPPSQDGTKANPPAPSAGARPRETKPSATAPFVYRGGMGGAYAAEQSRRSRAPLGPITKEELQAAVEALKLRMQAKADAEFVGF